MIEKQEYPRPQFVRSDWQNLNGEWEFAFDDQNVGLKEGWYKKEHRLLQRINVPFVYQAERSGIGIRKAHDTVWYKREFCAERKDGERVILHFGAVDYEAQVFVNGQLVMCHEGGHTPFETDITDYLEGAEGMQNVAVRAYDPHSAEEIPRGKQFWEEESRGIWYTNSTGIWQTVWLENIPEKHIADLKFTSLFDEGKVNFVCSGAGIDAQDVLEYRISQKGELVAAGQLKWITKTLDFDVDLVQNHIFRTSFHDDGWAWTPEHPTLFEVEVSIQKADGVRCDHVTSYFGMRKIHTENGMVYLNNKPYYQKLVLDQGYWKEGLLTAPNDDALKKDIELAKEMGFNGCRKHQKMEDPRFLYWADHLGYLVWGECASAPMYSVKAAERLMAEWAEIVDRDYNHPSIVVWVPLNESWGVPHIHTKRDQQHFSQTMYHYLHAIDPTRLVISNDGWDMTETDICAVHNYAHGQKSERSKYEEYTEMLSSVESLVGHPSSCWEIYAKGFRHSGEPVLLTEFGGIGFDTVGQEGWGYTSVADESEFLEDYSRLMDSVYASKGLWGFCYTQLSDVEQEINGLLTYGRKPKCSLEKIRQINERYHLSSLSCNGTGSTYR